MKRNLQAGESVFEGVVILAVLLLIVIVMPKGSPSTSSRGSVSPVGILSETQYESFSSTGNGGATISASPESGAISVGTGNASYTYQSYEEYVTLDNYGSRPVDITGWRLRNGKDQRPYYQGGMLQRFSADIASIPRAARILSPSGNSGMQNVVLAPGDQAIITTGSIGIRSPYQITSFKENICTGYLERLPEYAFHPALNQSCPLPSREPGIEGLPKECRDAILGISSCETPVFEQRDANGEYCETCLEEKPLPSYCAAFIEEHFSYEGCVKYHAGDPNFSGRTWRIFLGRGWEMWAEDYETIELFDSSGRLAGFANY